MEIAVPVGAGVPLGAALLGTVLAGHRRSSASWNLRSTNVTSG
jgi:hypothetical protein